MDTNSHETLQLVAAELEHTLATYLGPRTFYVLVLASDLSQHAICNCISNIPIDRSDQLKNVFSELSNRQVLAHN